MIDSLRKLLRNLAICILHDHTEDGLYHCTRRPAVSRPIVLCHLIPIADSKRSTPFLISIRWSSDGFPVLRTLPFSTLVILLLVASLKNDCDFEDRDPAAADTVVE